LKNIDINEGMQREEGGVINVPKSNSESRGFLAFAKDYFPHNVYKFCKALIYIG
jgi:hypothetical protein